MQQHVVLLSARQANRTCGRLAADDRPQARPHAVFLDENATRLQRSRTPSNRSVSHQVHSGRPVPDDSVPLPVDSSAAFSAASAKGPRIALLSRPMPIDCVHLATREKRMRRHVDPCQHEATSSERSSNMAKFRFAMVAPRESDPVCVWGLRALDGSHHRRAITDAGDLQ